MVAPNSASAAEHRGQHAHAQRLGRVRARRWSRPARSSGCGKRHSRCHSRQTIASEPDSLAAARCRRGRARPPAARPRCRGPVRCRGRRTHPEMPLTRAPPLSQPGPPDPAQPDRRPAPALSTSTSRREPDHDQPQLDPRGRSTGRGRTSRPPRRRRPPEPPGRAGRTRTSPAWVSRCRSTPCWAAANATAAAPDSAGRRRPRRRHRTDPSRSAPRSGHRSLRRRRQRRSRRRHQPGPQQLGAGRSARPAARSPRRPRPAPGRTAGWPPAPPQPRPQRPPRAARARADRQETVVQAATVRWALRTTLTIMAPIISAPITATYASLKASHRFRVARPRRQSRISPLELPRRMPGLERPVVVHDVLIPRGAPSSTTRVATVSTSAGSWLAKTIASPCCRSAFSRPASQADPLGVQPLLRLVHDQQLARPDEGGGQRQPAALTRGQGARQLARLRHQLDLLQHLVDHRVGVGQPVGPGQQVQVLDHAQVGEEVEVVDHGGHVAADLRRGLRHRVTAHLDRAVVGTVGADQAAQQGRLAGSVAPGQRDGLAARAPRD